MIQYANRGSKAYVALLLFTKGSVVPCAMPPAITSTALCIILAMSHREEDSEVVPDLLWANNVFAIQCYAIILGFLIVTRTNMALNRYITALSNFQIMVSNWQDACTQVCSFVNAHLEVEDPHQKYLMEWREQLAHWFSLMATFAVAALRGDEVMNQQLYESPLKDYQTGSLGRGEGRVRTSSKGFYLNIRKEERSPESKQDDGKDGESHPHSPHLRVPDLAKFVSSTFVPMGRSNDSRWPHDVERLGNKEYLEYLGSCTPMERATLNKVHDKVLVVSSWICESISRSMLRNRPGAPEGPVMKIPPPVISRVFQQLSNGMQAFHQALMVVIVPFPFPFAQMLSYLLLGFMIMSPFLVLQLTRSVIFSPILTFIGVFGYFGTDSIAKEIENPLGEDANDLPVLRLHTDYNNRIRELLLPLPHLGHMRSRTTESTAPTEAQQEEAPKCSWLGAAPAAVKEGKESLALGKEGKETFCERKRRPSPNGASGGDPCERKRRPGPGGGPLPEGPRHL